MSHLYLAASGSVLRYPVRVLQWESLRSTALVGDSKPKFLSQWHHKLQIYQNMSSMRVGYCSLMNLQCV